MVFEEPSNSKMNVQNNISFLLSTCHPQSCESFSIRTCSPLCSHDQNLGRVVVNTITAVKIVSAEEVPPGHVCSRQKLCAICGNVLSQTKQFLLLQINNIIH
jgi:hypothetical protein